MALNRCFWAVCAALSALPIQAQQTTQPADGSNQGEIELTNTRLVVLSGTIIVSKPIVVDGKTIQVPDMCRFRHHVPKGSAPLGWRQVGETLFHKDKGTCEGAFIEGEVPAAIAHPGAKPLAGVQPLGIYNYRRIRFTDPWKDPVNLTVAQSEVEVAYNYNIGCPISDDGLCSRHNSGSFTVYGFPFTLWITYTDSVYIINGGGAPHSYVGEGGKGVAGNSVFPTCTATDPAWVFFIPTEVYGYGDGSYEGYSSSSVAGTCSNLLHHGTTFFTVLTDA